MALVAAGRAAKGGMAQPTAARSAGQGPTARYGVPRCVAQREIPPFSGSALAEAYEQLDPGFQAQSSYPAPFAPERARTFASSWAARASAVRTAAPGGASQVARSDSPTG
jgi:hypothetical protein